MNLSLVCLNCSFLFSLISGVEGKRNFWMKISKIECIPRTPMINITCTETKSNRVAGLNIFVHFTEDIYDMRYDVEVLHLNKKGQWDSFFKFRNLDVCEYLAAKISVPVLLIARTIMRKFSNVPDECPIRKDTMYYVQRMKMDPELFPPYFPEGQFSATGALYNRNVRFVEYTIGIQAVLKKKIKSFSNSMITN